MHRSSNLALLFMENMNHVSVCLLCAYLSSFKLGSASNHRIWIKVWRHPYLVLWLSNFLLMYIHRAWERIVMMPRCVPVSLFWQWPFSQNLLGHTGCKKMPLNSTDFLIKWKLRYSYHIRSVVYTIFTGFICQM